MTANMDGDGWLVGWPVDWLVDWLVGCLVGWLVGWLIGWLVVDWLPPATTCPLTLTATTGSSFMVRGLICWLAGLFAG